jgi:hypothetical protein
MYTSVHRSLEARPRDSLWDVTVFHFYMNVTLVH